MTLLQKIVLVVAWCLVISAGVYFGIVRKYNLGRTPESEIYRNEQYGFQLPVPTVWHGITVLDYQWEGFDAATGRVTERGPQVTLRNGQWTTDHPYEDMPVMVFTPEQWNKVQKAELSVGAAPIPPSELGRNSRYVFALPARYNYDFADGWEEVDRLIHQLTTFEPK